MFFFPPLIIICLIFLWTIYDRTRQLSMTGDSLYTSSWLTHLPRTYFVHLNHFAPHTMHLSILGFYHATARFAKRSRDNSLPSHRCIRLLYVLFLFFLIARLVANLYYRTLNTSVQKPHRFHPGRVALCAICHYQKSLIRKLPF